MLVVNLMPCESVTESRCSGSPVWLRDDSWKQALVLCQYSGIRSGLTAHPYGIRIQIISRDSEIICYQSSIRVIPR